MKRLIILLFSYFFFYSILFLYITINIFSTHHFNSFDTLILCDHCSSIYLYFVYSTCHFHSLHTLILINHFSSIPFSLFLLLFQSNLSHEVFFVPLFLSLAISMKPLAWGVLFLLEVLRHCVVFFPLSWAWSQVSFSSFPDPPISYHTMRTAAYTKTQDLGWGRKAQSMGSTA